MTYLFANNARSTLAAGINDSVTALSVQAGDGALFPSPTGVEEFRCVIYNAAGDYEIITVTTRATDAFSVIVRGQEGTSPAAWSADDYISLRTTKESLEYMLQHSDVDDTPANGATTVPVSSNRMFDHEAGTAGIHPSGDITYDNGVSGLTATDVKAAIDETFAATAGSEFKLLQIKDFETGSNAPALTTGTGSQTRWAQYDFDSTSEESLFFLARLPANWDGSIFKIHVFGSIFTGATTFGVRWRCEALKGMADTDTMNGTSSTTGVSDTYTTANVMYISEISPVTTYVSAGDIVIFEIVREVGNAADTLDVDARLHCLLLEYGVTAGTES